MPQFTVNPHRFDPYKSFKFRVKVDNAYLSGVSRVSALRRVTEVLDHRDGTERSSPRKAPGQTRFDPLVLERGRTHDDEFERWAHKVWNPAGGPGSESSLKDFRKDILVELLNEAGQLVMVFKVYRCWPSEYVALEQLDANGTTVAIERLVLEHEGWERDEAVGEPEEPSF